MIDITDPIKINIGLREIAHSRYIDGTSLQILGTNLTTHTNWKNFQNFWEKLELDQYMNDGGRYRYRRFGRFKWFAEGNRIEQQPDRPYNQPKYFNQLNGDTDRYFAPLTPDMSRCPILSAILKTIGTVCAQIEDVPMWKINTYFNRIVADSTMVGKPVPEGMHRDGVKFSCLYLANRTGVSGGVTTLFDIINKEPIYTNTISQPGQSLIFRDDTVFHDTTIITPTDPSRPGYRDMLVIEFY